VCIFGASRDGGSGDGSIDARADVVIDDGAVGGSAGTAGAGGATGAAGAGGSSGRGGAAATGGAGTAIDAGADAAVDGGPDAGKAKSAAAAGDEGGCGCRVGASDRSVNTAWPLAGLLLLGLRRRRRDLGSSI